MKNSVIVLFLTGCFNAFFSQELSFSQRFDGAKKNQPQAILNHHEGYFHVLRYNTQAHDFIIEKRAKPSAVLMAFTPLRLDEVNASWFDYRNLDYLFFEHKGRLFFVFEKVVNTRKVLYMKVIDSLARASGFTEIAAMEADRNAADFNFEFKTTHDNKLLIVSSVTYPHHISKKIQLYDVESGQSLWIRRLPLENSSSGFSSAYVCHNEDLYYARVKRKIVSYERRYVNHQQTSVPVFSYEEVNLEVYPGLKDAIPFHVPLLANLNSFSGLQILPDSTGVGVQAWYSLSISDSTESKVYLYNSRWSSDLQHNFSQATTHLDTALEKRLTFFDGGDYDQPAHKDYQLMAPVMAGTQLWTVAGRSDDSYYKELVAWTTDPKSGMAIQQTIIPRKLFGFMRRLRFRYAADAITFAYKGRPCFVLAEAPGNLSRNAADFNYHRFRSENNLWRANVVMYCINDQGVAEKKLLHRNEAYDLFPLPYLSSGVNDHVFYLSSGRYEKFAILR